MTETTDAVLSGLDAHTTPLVTTEPLTEFGNLESLPASLTDSTVIGLGEATHGTRDFFRLKHRLLRYLVVECGLRTIGFEANLGELLALDAYAVHGEGDPEEILAKSYFWPWQVQSVLALFEWLREFNDGRPVADCVRCYGIDAQYTTESLGRLQEYFERVDPAFLEQVADEFDAADDEGTPPTQGEGPAIEFDAAGRLVEACRDRLAENREAYCQTLSQRDLELARQHVALIEQATEYRRILQQRRVGTIDEETGTRRGLRVRDRAMAENVAWMQANSTSDAVAVWAHDAHLNRQKQVVRESGISARPLGSFLAERYGEQYYALGFSFGRGSFQAVGQDKNGNYQLRKFTREKPVPGTIDESMSQFGHRVAFLDIRAARDDERLEEWLGGARGHFSVGATYDPDDGQVYITEYDYSEAFDGLVYVEKTSRARPLRER